MSVTSFVESHTERVRALRDAVFGSMNLSSFIWQPCQQIESLDEQSSKFVYQDQDVRGYASAYPLDATHFRLNLIVDPVHTRKGIGGLLLDKIENEVRRIGGQVVQARVFEQLPASRSFALSRGFTEIHTMRGMSLHKKDFSFDKWTALGEKLSATDFVVSNLKNEFEVNSDPIDRLAELYKLARHGWPSPDPSWRIEDSVEGLRSPFTRVSIPEHFWIMKHKGEYVAFTSAKNRTSGTAVHPDFRNLGIATYLKAHDIHKCIEDGKEYFESATASPAMGHVNEKLGFAFNGLAEVRFVKKLS
jgi:GNAT superfamily N-acetyltransferase